VKTRASAPGRLVLVGEHLVVHDKLAIVIAIGSSAHVTAELRSDLSRFVASGWSLPLQAREVNLCFEGCRSMRCETNWCRRRGMYDALAAEGRVGNIVKVIEDGGGQAFITRKMEEGVRF